MDERIAVADLIAERLEAFGVRHVFGVGGANIEDLFVAIQKRRPGLRAVLTKHEHGGGTAADAYARVSRGLGVALATSGGATMNLVHSLAEARASEVPLLALVGEPPSVLQGRGAFQDTSARGGAVDALKVLASVTQWSARAAHAGEVPRLLDEAVRACLGSPPGPAALLLPKELQTALLARGAEAPAPAVAPELRAPAAEALAEALPLLSPGACVIIAGADVSRAGAEPELAELALRLDAAVAVAPDARDAFDNRAPRFAGVAGTMGHPEVRAALERARTVVAVGTRLPLHARGGLEALLEARALVSFGREPPFLTPARSVHVAGDVLLGLRGVLGRPAENGVAAAVGARDGERSGDPKSPARRLDPARALDLGTVVAALDRALPQGSVVLADAGNTGAASAHGVRCPRHGRWLLAMGMAGMGWTFGASLGAALASGRRTVVLAGDGAFYMHGAEIHTAVEHALPITFVVFNNAAHGMCVVRERLLLKTDAGYNTFRASHLGAGLAATFPGLVAHDCRTAGELERALEHAFARPGPSVVVAELDAVEVPPFTAFQAAGGAAFSPVGSEP